MIQQTFCHLPRIGLRKEQSLWKQGVITWDDFLKADSVKGIADIKKPLIDKQISLTKKALFEGDSNHFMRLPSTETWRLWEEFQEKTCYIDIETNWRNDITVLGITDGENVWQFVRHINMDARAIKHVLSQFKLMVTFNGASFDLPIIRRYFKDVIPEIPHLDLRHAAAKVGLRGGLKVIEQEVGIARPEEVKGLSGSEALALWHAYRATGDKEHLNKLLQYNEEDIVNLKPLSRIIYDKLLESTKKYL